MKKLMLLCVLAFPMAAQADYVDVLGIKMTGACTMSKYLQAVKDFNEQWGKSHDYKAEILSPNESADLTQYFWVGRTANGESFGKALDAWMKGVRDETTLEAKLMARFVECASFVSRSGYTAH